MVNTLSHLGIGVLIALALGFKGQKRGVLAFLSIPPDLDFIPYILFALVSDNVSHQVRTQLFYLFGHREFMHSILFILLVMLLICSTSPTGSRNHLASFRFQNTFRLNV